MRLYLDIETLPSDAAPGMDPTDPPGWASLTAADAPKNYKKPASRQAWADEENLHQAEAWWRKASLDPRRGRVAMIGTQHGIIDCAEDEHAGLLRLLDLFGNVDSRHIDVVIVGHNALGFDVPFVAHRAIQAGLPELAGWLAVGRWGRGLPSSRHNVRVVDTSESWPRVGSRRFISLDDAAAAVGVTRSANPIAGSQVLDAYLNGDWHLVRDHCLDDISTLVRVADALQKAGRVRL